MCALACTHSVVHSALNVARYSLPLQSLVPDTTLGSSFVLPYPVMVRQLRAYWPAVSVAQVQWLQPSLCLQSSLQAAQLTTSFVTSTFSWFWVLIPTLGQGNPKSRHNKILILNKVTLHKSAMILGLYSKWTVQCNFPILWNFQKKKFGKFHTRVWNFQKIIWGDKKMRIFIFHFLRRLKVTGGGSWLKKNKMIFVYLHYLHTPVLQTQCCFENMFRVCWSWWCTVRHILHHSHQPRSRTDSLSFLYIWHCRLTSSSRLELS